MKPKYHITLQEPFIIPETIGMDIWNEFYAVWLYVALENSKAGLLSALQQREWLYLTFEIYEKPKFHIVIRQILNNKKIGVISPRTATFS